MATPEDSRIPKLEIKPIFPQKFNPSDPKALEYFDEHGYVVFSQVANEDQLSQATSLFWDHMEASTGVVKRDDPDTWVDENWPGMVHVGILNTHGIGQSGFLWFCRGLPKVKQAFETIWNDPALLVSLDGAGAFRPAQYNLKWQTNDSWWHVDQSGRKRGRHAVQGLLNVYQSGERDGGLTLWPGSHKAFEAYWDRAGHAFMNDYVMLHHRHEMWTEVTEMGLSPVKLCLEPGDLALWDSRTIHCNSPSWRTELDRPCRLNRMVAYICMTPVKLVEDPEVLEERIQGYFKWATCNHWPHFYDEMSRPNQQSSQGPRVLSMQLPKLNADQRALLGGRSITDKEWDEFALQYALPRLKA